ncbi:hypothetical protein ACPA9J_34025 [Pseudomonas aeruginosa]
MPIARPSQDTCEIEGKFVRQSGGRGQFGHCWIRFSAAADERATSEGLEFEQRGRGRCGSPKEYIPAIQKGIEEQMKNGVLAGYPLDRPEGDGVRWFLP